MIFFGRTIRFLSVTIYYLQRVVRRLESNLFPNQLLEIVLDVGKLGFHVLEEHFAGMVVLDVAWRSSPPFRLAALSQRVLIERASLMGKGACVGT